MVNKHRLFKWKSVVGSGGMVCVLAFSAWMGIAQARTPDPAAQKSKKSATKPAKPTTPPEKLTSSTPSFRAAEGSLRDPFKLPPKPTEGGPTSPEQEIVGPLPPGSRGLIIGQLRLEGIVRQGMQNPKMIAVLANPANRAYFLRENDPLYNGVITKITPDSVYFREDVKDASGKMTSHEVVKKLAPASGEKK